MQPRQLEDSMRHYLETIQLCPKHEGAIYSYANLLRHLGRFDRAEEFYLMLLDLNVNHIEAYIDYAKLLERYNRWEDANSCYQQGIQCNPNNDKIRVISYILCYLFIWFSICHFLFYDERCDHEFLPKNK